MTKAKHGFKVEYEYQDRQTAAAASRNVLSEGNQRGIPSGVGF